MRGRCKDDTRHLQYTHQGSRRHSCEDRAAYESRITTIVLCCRSTSPQKRHKTRIWAVRIDTGPLDGRRGCRSEIKTKDDGKKSSVLSFSTERPSQCYDQRVFIPGRHGETLRGASDRRRRCHHESESFEPGRGMTTTCDEASRSF